MLPQAWIVVVVCGATLYTTDAQITGWTVPSITGANGTGTITIPEGQATGATSTTFSATPTASDNITSYTLVNSSSTFSVDSSTGVLSLESALDYETTTSYELQIEATDSASNKGTATVSITVTDNVAPAFSASSYTACVADASTTGQSVTTLTATDQDGDTITYSIFSGNANNTFTLSAAELLVNTGVTLNQTTTAEYTLVVHAEDTDPPTANTATATITVTVGDTAGVCSSAAAMAFSIMTILMAYGFGCVDALNIQIL